MNDWKSSAHPGLFKRYSKNPILTAADWPYPVNTVFNSGATQLADGTTLLLCRVETHDGFTHFCVARSENGVDNWQIDPEPTLLPAPDDYPEETWGIEDARITFVPELDQYVIAYTAYSSSGPGVSLAFTRDFEQFERAGLVLPPENKDAAVFPRQFDGRWALIHRPVTPLGAHMWIAYSPDLHHWGDNHLMLSARSGPWWDASKIGLSPPPIETPEGWLVIYHGVRRTAAGALYRQGLALFDLENPHVCLRRSDSWMVGPDEIYELHGDVGYVVFICGVTVADDGDTLNIYYGAADTSMALARSSISEMLDWLEQEGSSG